MSALGRKRKLASEQAERLLSEGKADVKNTQDCSLERSALCQEKTFDTIKLSSLRVNSIPYRLYAILFQIYYYFSSSVSFFRVPDRRRYFTQSITLVYDRSHFARLHEVAQKNQVILLNFRQQIDELLSHE